MDMCSDVRHTCVAYPMCILRDLLSYIRHVIIRELMRPFFCRRSDENQLTFLKDEASRIVDILMSKIIHICRRILGSYFHFPATTTSLEWMFSLWGIWPPSLKIWSWNSVWKWLSWSVIIWLLVDISMWPSTLSVTLNSSSKGNS